MLVESVFRTVEAGSWRPTDATGFENVTKINFSTAPRSGERESGVSIADQRNEPALRMTMLWTIKRKAHLYVFSCVSLQTNHASVGEAEVRARSRTTRSTPCSVFHRHEL